MQSISENKSSLKALAPVLEGQGEWYGSVLLRLFYPDKFQKGDIPAMPGSFVEWLETAHKAGDVSRPALDRLIQIHADLQKLAGDLLIDSLNSVSRPDIKSYELLSDIYDEFTSNLRRLEKDFLLADTGIDPLTGLRSRRAMDKDLERELERRARRGKPFSLVLVHIDDYQSLSSDSDRDSADNVVRSVASMIQKSIRSFDDAYRTAPGEFIMALKQAELSGASAAIKRMNRFLEEKPVLFSKENSPPVSVTLSYCVAEPMPGDNVEELLANMRIDLKPYENKGGAAVEYHELSPVQRFLVTADGK